MLSLLATLNLITTSLTGLKVGEREEDKARITTGPECTVELVQVAVLYGVVDRSLEQKQQQQQLSTTTTQPPTTTQQGEKRPKLKNGSNRCLHSNQLTSLRLITITYQLVVAIQLKFSFLPMQCCNISFKLF